MDMYEKLIQLYKTLELIETKGESTKIMCDCLMFTEKLIGEAAKAKEEAAKAKEDSNQQKQILRDEINVLEANCQN